jgi:membrane protein YqaA with SNARE-associated domain
MIFKILTIIGLATFEVYAAIPAGFAFQLSPLVIFLSSTTGGLIGVVVAAYLGSLIQRFFAKYRKTPKEEKPKSGFILRVWEKYGLVGLGVIGTMTVGGPISIGVGVGFNVPINKLVFYCCIGVIARCAIFTFLGELGMKLLGH